MSAGGNFHVIDTFTVALTYIDRKICVRAPMRTISSCLDLTPEGHLNARMRNLMNKICSNHFPFPSLLHLHFSVSKCVCVSLTIPHLWSVHVQ